MRMSCRNERSLVLWNLLLTEKLHLFLLFWLIKMFAFSEIKCLLFGGEKSFPTNKKKKKTPKAKLFTLLIYTFTNRKNLTIQRTEVKLEKRIIWETLITLSLSGRRFWQKRLSVYNIVNIANNFFVCDIFDQVN